MCFHDILQQTIVLPEKPLFVAKYEDLEILNSEIYDFLGERRFSR